MVRDIKELKSELRENERTPHKPAASANKMKQVTELGRRL